MARASCNRAEPFCYDITMPKVLRDDNLFEEFTSQCDFCDWERKFHQALSSGLVVGSIVFAVAEDYNFNRCNRCKRTVMRVTKVPKDEKKTEPKGFWMIPEE